jgi:hypothetical protein
MIKLKDILKEADTEKFGLKYNDEDHYVVHNSLRDMNDGVNGVWLEGSKEL